MKSRLAPIIACAFSFRAIQAQTAIRVWDTHAGSVLGRVWFGDEIAYVGPSAPPGVKSAYNVTASETRDNLLFIEVDGATSLASAKPLPDPTFLVIKTGVDSGGDVYHAHSAVGLTDNDIYLIENIEGFIFPWSRLGMVAGAAFLIPTEVEGTSAVRWFTNPADGLSLNGTSVTIAIRRD